MKKRKYNLKRRAKRQEETRERIVDAVVALHEELGPRATTVSAIAERAGVQRLTVYRHFPDSDTLFQACTSHWLELNPPPDPGEWCDEPAGRRRVYAALAAVYRYYSATERMWSQSYRDVGEVEALQGPMAAFERHLDAIRDDLASGWAQAGHSPPPLRTTLRHCLRFSTWQSLQQEGLEDAGKARLATAWVTAAGCQDPLLSGNAETAAAPPCRAGITRA